MMTYFWDGKQVIQVDRPVSVPACGSYLDMFCVDGYQDTDYSRYGMFNKHGVASAFSSAWKHIPYSMFPKEFKAHLLLLL